MQAQVTDPYGAAAQEVQTKVFSDLFLERVSLLGSGPEGADDLCFHTGEISPSCSPSPSPSSPSTPFEAHILAMRLKSQP